MSLKANTRKNKKTFSGLEITSIKGKSKKSGKPRPIKNPGSRAGLKKGAGG